MRRRRKLKLKVKNIAILLVVVLVLIFGIKFLDKSYSKEKLEENLKIDFKNMKLSDVEAYAKEHNLKIEKSYKNSDIEKDYVIESTLKDKTLTLIISKGAITLDELREKGVNELGKVPIMMYHGIVNEDAKFIGGNVDKDGYTRTSKAFLADLEFYYEKGYRMVRLEDYINGKIDVPLGYSPIILTFDDGNANNFKVTGRDENGNLEFDPMSALGILETIKKKYPDFNVTATFFLNSGLCNQPEYNNEIMKFLLENGYDIGNHTTTHPDFTTIGTSKTQEVVGKIYKTFEELIPGKYVKIVALPFGSPYKKTHANYPYILKGEYDGYSYETEAALRVGWESEVSPFDKSFDKTFLKRCRAYDNNGVEFDITMNFKLLENNRFISDGDVSTITIPVKNKDKLIDTDKKVITYEED